MRTRIVAALFAVAAAFTASADGAATFSAQCAACHGRSGEGTKMGPAIAGMPATEVRHAIEIGGGRDHKPGTKWKMKPVQVGNVEAVSIYVAGLKK
jgi:mono/diheme cytochrome c family protein